jgi:hypothetical protein
MIMTSKAELQGAFGSLLDTLQNRLDPFQTEDVVSRWTGIIARAAEVARSRGWNGLPDEDGAYDRHVAALNGASAALAGADYSDGASVHAALDLAEGALDALAALVGA